MNDRFANRRSLSLATSIALALASASLAAAEIRFPLPHGIRAEAAAARNALRARHPATPRGPGVVPVTSCTDDGTPGELRAVVGDAISGDTIDLSGLACSAITLQMGAVAFGTDLVIHGPTDHVLTIDGGGTDSIFVGYGIGATAIDHLTIAHGRFDGDAGAPYVLGGCTYFLGEITLDTVTITDCSAGTADIPGYGAGAFVSQTLAMSSSTVSASTAHGASGVFVGGDVQVIDSTISGNYAAYIAAGLTTVGTLVAHNSTIAFNTAAFANGGVFLQGDPVPTIESTIIADNTGPDGAPYAADLSGNVLNPIMGSHDLIIASDLPLPADTLNVDPMLAPLADNGGPTPTHALAAASPAIDAGSNVDTLPFDQRGDGYPRESGAGADIGAFELQPPTEMIFADGFDGST